jgi:flagellar FliJ protein
MKRFEFALQRVLDVRETEEKNLQRNLALAQYELRVAEELKEEIAQRLTTEMTAFGDMRRQTTTSDAILLHQRYLQSLRETLDQQGQVIVGLERKVESARLALLEKTKERKSLERLRENQLEAYNHEQNKMEQAFLDETSAQNSKFRFAGGNS